MRGSTCKFCGKAIEWGELFGKRHPFDLDGMSHMDTCSEWDRRRFSLRTLGDLDTFYRQRWCHRFLGEGRGFDLSRLTVCQLDFKDALRLGEALYYIGGPLRFLDWPPDVIARHCYAGAMGDQGLLVSVSVDRAVLWRLRDYLGESAFRVVYEVAGLYLLHGTGAELHRGEGWS